MRRWLYRMQYKYGRYGIENLMMYITVTMLAVFLSEMLLRIPASQYLYFDRALILRGQIWRTLTFIFLPLNSSPLFILLTLYVYYFLGNALEGQWGKFQFTLYYAIGILGAILSGFLTGYATNTYLNLSLLLAFAQLFPDVEFRIFFLVPVKVKYIGYVNWILYGISLLFALFHLDLPQIAAILASLLNFFLFFGPDVRDNLARWLKYSGRRRQFKRDTRDYRDRW